MLKSFAGLKSLKNFGSRALRPEMGDRFAWPVGGKPATELRRQLRSQMKFENERVPQ